jgi:DnaJ-like protein
MAADPRDAVRPFDAYAVLEVDPTATTDDIRRAYRRLARALHPDANPGDAAAADRFRRVADAHALLSDPLRRARYDVLQGYTRSPVGPRPVRHGPSPSGNAAVRGPGARPSHQPREAPPAAPRRETDEWSFLGRFARWAAVALIATALAVLVLLIAAPRAEPTPPPQMVPRGVPGGGGFCQVPEGWVACQLVAER